ncbi:MAG TPA: type III PLP-dependent enzyme [Agromyces sp.]|jgi:ornithine decarboxylase
MSTTLGARPRQSADRTRNTSRAGSSEPARPPAEQPPHRELVRRELSRYAARIRLDALLREHGSPLFVLDVDRVTTQLLALRRELPDVQIHFATKSLPHPAVIHAVDAFGASFEVASRGEIDLLEREGVAIGRCVHTHPVKTVADITGAYLRGIRTFVLDSHGEVSKFRGLPSDVAVLVRLSFPNPEVRCDLSSKFGVPPEHAGELVEHCVRAGLRVAGFTFHVGSQALSAEPWMRAIHRTLALMRRLERAHRIGFDTLDIGGGFPVSYDEPVPEFGTLARGIRTALAEAPRRYRVLVEPGRFLSAPAMTLATRVVGTTQRDDGPWAYLDDGVYGAFSNIPSEATHPLVFAASELGVRHASDLEPDRDRAERRLRALAHEPVTLAGPTCDSLDVIARALPLPPLRAGDVLVSPMMGAYTSATATGFNGFAPTPIVVLPG